MAAKQETADSFKTELNNALLSGFKVAGISLGIKLDLFKAFGDSGAALTSEDLAKQAGCKERYVREWLHHMVMCDVVDVDQSGKLFSLPKYRHDALLGADQMINFMGPAFPALLGPHYELLDCFRTDGPNGLPFEAVEPFFNERTYKNVAGLKQCAEIVCDKVPGLKDELAAGIKVLEIGTGNGGLLLHIASKFPASSFTGIDLCNDFLDKAKHSMAEQGLSNVSLVLQDATKLPNDWNDSFDLVVVRDALHDIAETSKALSSIYKVLKPKGKFAVFEVNLSENPYNNLQNPRRKLLGQLAYIISCYHCLSASLYYPGSEGLGAGAGQEKITRLIQQAGFETTVEPQQADLFNLLYIVSKP